MKKNFFLAITLVVGSLMSSVASAQSQPVLSPSLGLTQLPQSGGLVVSPGASLNVPIGKNGGGVSVGAQTQVVVPPSGKSQMGPTTINITGQIPLGGKR